MKQKAKNMYAFAPEPMPDLWTRSYFSHWE